MNWINKLLNLLGRNKKFKVENLKRILKNDDVYKIVIELDDIITKACNYGDDLEALSDPQKNFFYNQNLEMEVNNGGFNQYFINSAGNNAHETIESLRSIGAFKTASILQEAINHFPGANVPKDRDERIDIVLQIDEEVELFDGLNNRFYKYEEDLSLLNLEYIRKNSDVF